MSPTPPEPDRPASADRTAALRVEGLHVTVGHGRSEAVRDVSFDILPGEAVGLVGESGSGKTLTCRSVLGLPSPGVAVSAGRIVLGGTADDGDGDGDAADLVALTDRQWQQVRGTRIGAVFQDPGSYLNPALTVGRQLGEPLRGRGFTRAEARRRAVELFEAVGLHDPERVHDSYPHELSGGMLQRVLIAVAISGEPQLLVADEATTALDTVIQAEVLDLLDVLRDRHGLALLLVSHDLAVVAEVCDRVLVLYAGEVVEEGPTAEVVAAPAHPYTEALLRVASLGRRDRRELAVIPGRPPEPGAAGAGCRFAPRCEYATAACTEQAVPLTPVPAPGTGPRSGTGSDTGAAGRAARCLRSAELLLTGVRDRADATERTEVPM
ncbi:ABC transporter ATP-binding protein [Kitasatospora purpeofusca]|uniref:ABC transporter ATP-binding protein n=1 Tax=Kitasatospora purpeofusca TaxID=67352 RepID=UPI00225B767E|nr:ABC transporter ATP-binding protein [Kitasatospora purpeofusca]MCX4690452.1 ABC transporter ATP-binding protein [Kitasatospora purpeofusca]